MSSSPGKFLDWPGSCLGCSVFARVDLFLDERTGQLLVNEVNAIPGMAATSVFPKVMRAAGAIGDRSLTAMMDATLELMTKAIGLGFRAVKMEVVLYLLFSEPSSHAPRLAGLAPAAGARRCAQPLSGQA
jgi:hypothetical protein